MGHISEIAALVQAVALLLAVPGVATALGRLEKRLVGRIKDVGTAVGNVGNAVGDVKSEVKTANAQSVANLLDATETRRIVEIPDAARTDAERHHLIDSPLPPPRPPES